MILSAGAISRARDFILAKRIEVLYEHAAKFISHRD